MLFVIPREVDSLSSIGNNRIMQRFGFIIHPISARQDVARKYRIARYFPERVVEAAIKYVPPKMVSHITGVKSIAGPEAEGWFIGCPLSPRQFLELPEPFVTTRITHAARVAQELGAKIVGLGAYTSIAGDAGISVAKGVDIAVTTGNTYTNATAIEATRKAADLMGIDIRCATAAVVGATGAIGSACARLLADDVPRLVLIARDLNRLEPLAEELRPQTEVICTTDIAEGLRDVDLIITVTSAIEAVIPPETLKPGCVLCDVARPRDVSPLVAKHRPDVLVIDGGVISVPGDVDFHFNFGFPPHTSYACMAETMILALEGKYESYSLGRTLDVSKAKEISALAAKHGFKLAGFRCFERAVTDEHIAQVRLAAEKRLKAQG
jgi:fatty aldehyde-generating acyl-ACP reductase